MVIPWNQYIDALDDSEDSDNSIDINIYTKPLKFIKQIKHQLDNLFLECKSTDNSGQTELKHNFLSDLSAKLNEYLDNDQDDI